MNLKKMLLLALALAVFLLVACGGDEAEGTGPVEDLAESPIGTSSSYWQSSANESSSSEVAGAMDVPADEPAESVEMAESSESVESSGLVESSGTIESSESVEISSSSSENEAVSSSRGSEDIVLSSTVDPEILVKASPCRVDSTDSCEYGTLTDERDGQTYKTVKIGNLWWMAENLNYAYLQPVADMDSGSFCYNDSLEYCEKYGRLYPWAVALGICPSGWHLPWYEEYKTLIGGSTYASGMGLKSTEWNGTDVFGFAALPSGARYYFNGSYTYTLDNMNSFGGGQYEIAIFWTDTKVAYDIYSEGELAVTFTVYPSSGGTLRTGDVNDSYAVRCVKDY